MKRLVASVRLCARQLLLVGVLACVCFSTGEGLRLLPYVNPAEAREEQSVQPEIAAPNEARLPQYAYGLETSAQKRVKRQERDGWLLPLLRVAAAPSERRYLADEEPASSYHSLCSVLQPPGRAPPAV